MRSRHAVESVLGIGQRPPSKHNSASCDVQDAGTIQVLPAYLQRSLSSEVQLEALHAMYNLCKISPARQEAAAVAGVVPLLVKLAQPLPPDAPSVSQLSTHTTGKLLLLHYCSHAIMVVVLLVQCLPLQSA